MRQIESQPIPINSPEQARYPIEENMEELAGQMFDLTFFAGHWDYTIENEYLARNAHIQVFDAQQPLFGIEGGAHGIVVEDPIGVLTEATSFIRKSVESLKKHPQAQFLDHVLHMQYEYKALPFNRQNLVYPHIRDQADIRSTVDNEKLNFWSEPYVYPSEYLIFRSLATHPEKLKDIPKITDAIVEAMQTNPAHTFGLLHTLGVDTLMPNFPMFIFLDDFTRQLEQWKSVKNEYPDGVTFFVEALTQNLGIMNTKEDSETSMEYLKRILQVVPHLEPYVKYDLPRHELQDHSFYMYLALASGEYSARSGRGPFGAVLVHPDGRFIIATNEIDPITGKKIRAEKIAVRKGYKFWGERSAGDWKLYSPAEPCFGCAEEIMHDGPISQVVYAVPTTMGMDFFDLTRAKHLEKLECGIPDMKQGILEAMVRRFYNQKQYIDLIRPENQKIATAHSGT